LERGNNTFRQSCQPIAKVNNPADPVRTFNGAMLLGAALGALGMARRYLMS